MKPDTILSIPPQVMSRLVDDDTVLLDLESGGDADLGPGAAASWR